MSVISLRQEKNKQNLENFLLYSILTTVFFIPLDLSLAEAALFIGILALLGQLFWYKNLTWTNLPFDTPIFVFAGISLISCFVSPDKFFSFYNYTHTLVIYLLVYILIGQTNLKNKQIGQILKAILSGFLLCVLYGLSQAFFGITTSDILWVDSNAFPELKKRIFSTFQNPNIFAGYITMILALMLGLFAKSNSKKEKLMYFVLSLLGITALLYTYSRASIFAILGIFLIFGIIYDKRLIIIYIIFFAIFAHYNPLIIDRIASVFFSMDTSMEMRLAFYEATLAMIEDHLLLGCGWGAYFMAYPQYDFYMHGESIKIVHAHNIYLNYAAEVGIIGALVFFWFFFGTVKMTLTPDKTKEKEQKNQEEKQEETAVKNLPIIKYSPQKTAKILELTNILKGILTLKEIKKENQIFKEEREPKERPSAFEKFLNEKLFEDEKSVREGLALGIGLMFIVVALNGLFDDLLFNIPTSMSLWLFAALAAKNHIQSDEF